MFRFNTVSLNYDLAFLWSILDENIENVTIFLNHATGEREILLRDEENFVISFTGTLSEVAT